MASTPVNPPSLGSTFGWLFIAAIISSLLFGMALIQFYNYCDTFWKSEKWMLKGPIVLAMLIDTVHIIIIVSPTYKYLVQDFASYEDLQYNSSELASAAVLTGLAIAVAQLLFVSRVYHLSNGSKIWATLLCVLIAAEFSSIQVCYNTVAHARLFSQLATKSALAIEKSMNALILTTDVALATSLIVLLYRSRSGLQKSDNIVSKIITYVISTSAVLAIVQVLCLIAVVRFPLSLAYIAGDLIASKCYINCMFVSLNARQSLRRKMTESNIHGISIELPDLASKDTESSATRSQKDNA